MTLSDHFKRPTSVPELPEEIRAWIDDPSPAKLREAAIAWSTKGRPKLEFSNRQNWLRLADEYLERTLGLCDDRGLYDYVAQEVPRHDARSAVTGVLRDDEATEALAEWLSDAVDNQAPPEGAASAVDALIRAGGDR
jgi:hypothetical protein